MNKIVFILILVFVSFKSSENIPEKSTSSKGYIEKLIENKMLGENPLVFIEGKKVGFYSKVEHKPLLLNYKSQYKTFVPKQSSFLKSVIGSKASNGIVLLGKSGSLRNRKSIIDKIILEGELIDYEDFRKLDPKTIKSINLVPDIELTENTFYELTLVHLKK